MVELTKENFEAEVEQAEGYIFIDFYGDGCVPCAALMPHVHALKQGVMGLPVMAIYKDGKQVEALVKDECTQDSITALVEKYVNM